MLAGFNPMRRLLTLTGWARAALLFACGAGAALALAPFFLWPLLFPAYGLFLHYLSRAQSAKTAFRLSWWWGFGFFLTGLYWVCIAMTVDLARFGWMIPFALLGLNGGLALFTALSGLGFYYLRRDHAVVNWLLFSLLLFAGEWLRGHILTGFPWNLIGYAWGASDVSLQVAALLPMYPLTLMTLLLAASAALWRQYRVLAAGVLAVLLALHGYGFWRLHDAPPFEPGVSVRVVQASIPQRLKWDPAHLAESLRAHVAHSLSGQGEQAPDLLIWPESAFPYAIDVNAPFPAGAFGWLQPHQTLVTGAVFYDRSGADPAFFNSIMAVNGQGELLARYDKQHLVPFGEYVPLRGLLPIDKLTAGLADFVPGDGERILAINHYLIVQPLICYEAIFPAYADAPAGGAPRDMLLNLTNDDWFGDSSGPYQHLTMSRFRAVEQGLPMIRAANSGISAVIDAHGRIVQSLALDKKGRLDIASPAK